MYKRQGNHRIQVVDLVTRQLRALWGQPDPYAEPQPSDAAGRFAAPVALAVDAAGAIYVAEAGNRRVQKLDADGRADLSFTLTGVAPAALAVTLIDGQERLLLIERDGSLRFYALDGSLDEVAAQRWQALAENNHFLSSDHLHNITEVAIHRLEQQLGKPYVWGGQRPAPPWRREDA